MKKTLAALVLAALPLAACGASESDAREKLEKDGMTDLKLTPGKDGSFDFSGNDKEGALCTGSITVQKSGGSSTSQVQKSCASP